MDKLYGFATKEAFTRADALYGMHALTAKGVLTSDGAVFRVEQAYRDAVDCIRHKRFALAVQTPDSALSDYCVYAAERLLVTELTGADRSRIRFSFSAPDALWEDLLQSGYIPPQDEDFDFQEDAYEFNEAAIIETFDRDGRIPAHSGVMLMLRKSNGSDTVVVIQRELFCYLYVNLGGEKKRMPYSRQRLEACYRKVLAPQTHTGGGEENGHENH
ncbi:MAG: hypothetical protein QM689_11320 [Oscillospiraceae bacterium]